MFFFEKSKTDRVIEGFYINKENQISLNKDMISFLLILAFLSASLTEAQSPKLIFVQQVFRHGARYPIYPSSKDKSDFATEQHSVGELTSQGKAMHYMLGKLLFQDYWGRLFGSSNSYNQSKFYFKSTDVNRTIESIQSQLMGIFEHIDTVKITNRDLDLSLPAWNYTLNRLPGDVFSSAATYHPLPIHVEKSIMDPWYPGDFLRTYAPEVCPRQSGWMAENKNDPYVKKIVANDNFTKAVQAVNKALDINATFFDVYKYFDNAQCMIHLDMLPNEIFRRNNHTLKDLTTMYVLDGYIKLFYSQKQLRAISTGYFNETVRNFKKVTKDQSGVQWAFYSAHDTTVMNFLARLGLTSVKCIYQNYLNGTVQNSKTEYCIPEYPTYTSSLIFEVYQYDNGTNTFKIRYNGNYRKIPICGYAEECSVQSMYSWYDSWKDEDFIKSCGITDNDSSLYFSFSMAELAVIIVLGVMILMNYLNKKQPEVRREPQKNVVEREVEKEGEKMGKQSLLSDDIE